MCSRGATKKISSIGFVDGQRTHHVATRQKDPVAALLKERTVVLGRGTHPELVWVKQKWDGTIQSAGLPWIHLWSHSNKHSWASSPGYTNSASEPQGRDPN